MPLQIPDVLAPLLSLGDTGQIRVDGKALPVGIEAKWIARTIAVGIVKQIRANLRAGKGPDALPLPPLRDQGVARARQANAAFSGRRVPHATRGIATGLLLRSIKSANAGDGAVVYVEGERGQRHGGDLSAAEAVFLDSWNNPRLDQPYVEAALQKAADAVALAKAMDETLAQLAEET